MLTANEPIVARASGSGRGGIGVVRVSGNSEAVSKICLALFPNIALKPRHAHLLPIRDADGELIDRAIVIYFCGPASYTGEDVLEIQAHGGAIVQQWIVDRLLDVGKSVGLRLAQPGEFTQRAYLNGRMDLAQAEAVADLIDATTRASARAASRSMNGVFSQQVAALDEQLTTLRAFIEATLDFPEEEIEFVQAGHVNEQVQSIHEKLQMLQKTAMRGKVLRDGLTIVLVGAPNVGKSSLLNALAGEEVAIVTDIAGTTRDRISQTLHLDGLPVNVIDTAGVRLTNDPIEQIGINRTLEAIREADVVLHLVTVDDIAFDEVDKTALEMIRNNLREGVTYWTGVNKIDLHPSVIQDVDFQISAKTGVGISELIEQLKTLAGMNDTDEGDFMARSRHLECLARAQEHIEVISAGRVGQEIGLDIAAEELRLAGKHLGEIVGEHTPDDILGQIFARFCIGK